MNGLLKFITCGSVDDGKSTLIGHMLYDAKMLFADQQQALELDSKAGSRGGKLDYSLLLDGLMAEREQGITIDVAYRYFTTENRSFIVADTPGHEEYTRNMAVGASFAELAVILVDATQGILIQTLRHARICALMGIEYFVFAVNKMDLVHYDVSQFKKIEKAIRKLAVDLDLINVTVIPVSATEGDNVTLKSANMSWYTGTTLLEYLETVDIITSDEANKFVMPVQRVCRPNREFRGFQGRIKSGTIRTGSDISVFPSREVAKIKQILLGDKVVDEASNGSSVTIVLDKEIDVSRGSVLAKEDSLIVSNMFTATILWTDDDCLVEGKNYYLKIATRLVPATVMHIKHKVDINTGEFVSSSKIYKNEIALCDIVVSEKIAYECFKNLKEMGRFILIDRITNMTSGCGIIEHPLRRSENITWQATDVTREVRASRMNQKPLTLWFTGLSGSGKSTLANAVEKRLVADGRYTMLLDGDNVRLGLNKNLGFEEKDRIENIRRNAEVSKLMNDAGLIVLAAAISPYKQDRDNARSIIGSDSFVEIYVSTPLEECEKRDVKGLYKKARCGEIPNFTGVTAPYEAPANPDISLDTSKISIADAVEEIMLIVNKFLNADEEEK